MTQHINFSKWGWLVAALALLGAMEGFFPRAVTIIDEVYYTGQAHALSEGRWRPTPADPFPMSEDGRPYTKYPLGWPLILTASVPAGPQAVLRLTGFLHLLGAGLFGWLLYRRKLPLAYTVFFLLQPGLFFYSRTTMAETVVVMLVLGMIVAADYERWTLAGALLGLTVNIRIGSLILCGVFGWWLLYEMWRGRLRFSAAFGAMAAMALMIALLPFHFFLTTGRFLPTVYMNEVPMTVSAMTVLRNTGFYGVSLLLILPGLLLGAWRCRSLERTLALALILFHCVYFFHDSGRYWRESLIVGQRLILPAIALLLLGYAQLVSEWQRRWAGTETVLLAIALTGALAIGVNFGRYQKEFYMTALAIDAALPPHVILGYDHEALKLLPMLTKPDQWMPISPKNDGRILCPWPYYLVSQRFASYRLPWVLPPRKVDGQLLADYPLARLYRVHRS